MENKKRKKRYRIHPRAYLFLGILIILIIGLIWTLKGCFNDAPADAPEGNAAVPKIPIQLEADGQTPVPPAAVIPGTEAHYETAVMITNPADIDCIVNRKYNLSGDYTPSDLVTVSVSFAPGRTEDVQQMRQEASQALLKLFEAAHDAGYTLYGASGYRSYNVQKILFMKNMENAGSVEEANRLTALPGQSEHQLGLAMDIAIESMNFRLDESFGETPEGKWLAENCWKHGFIIRYPKEKTQITGYSYEPWHIRYVGTELAEYLGEKGLTLEEYYGVK